MDIHEDATICERQSWVRQLPATKASARIVFSRARLAVVDWNKKENIESFPMCAALFYLYNLE